MTKDEIDFRITQLVAYFSVQNKSRPYYQLLDCVKDIEEYINKPNFGEWERVYGLVTPGGTPVFRCPMCHKSDHLHGAEYPKRKMYCESCGSITYYPWEKIYDQDE